MYKTMKLISNFLKSIRKNNQEETPQPYVGRELYHTSGKSLKSNNFIIIDDAYTELTDEQKRKLTEFLQEDFIKNPCKEINLPMRVTVDPVSENHRIREYSWDHSLVHDRELIAERLRQNIIEFTRNISFRTDYYMPIEHPLVGCHINEERSFEELEAATRHMYNIHETKCKYFSNNIELRCAVNPMGTCSGCADFEE